MDLTIFILSASDADLTGASQSDGSEGGSDGAERSVPAEGSGQAEGSNRAACRFWRRWKLPSNSPSARSGQSGRQHGSRGCASRANSRSSSNKTKTVKWRSGASPPAPTFEGGIDVDPYCAWLDGAWLLLSSCRRTSRPCVRGNNYVVKLNWR